MADELFHIVDDCQIILICKGVYRQTNVYRRNDKIYAKWGSGFVRLLASGGTSKTDVRWESLPDDPAISRSTLDIVYLSPKVIPRTIEHKPAAVLDEDIPCFEKVPAQVNDSNKERENDGWGDYDF